MRCVKMRSRELALFQPVTRDFGIASCILKQRESAMAFLDQSAITYVYKSRLRRAPAIVRSGMQVGSGNRVEERWRMECPPNARNAKSVQFPEVPQAGERSLAVPTDSGLSWVLIQRIVTPAVCTLRPQRMSCRTPRYHAEAHRQSRPETESKMQQRRLKLETSLLA